MLLQTVHLGVFPPPHPTPIAKSGYASAAVTRHDLNLHPSPDNFVPFNNATIESCTPCILSMVTRSDIGLFLNNSFHADFFFFMF